MNTKLKLIHLALLSAFAVSNGAWAQAVEGGAASGAAASGGEADKGRAAVESQEVPTLPSNSSVQGGGLFGPVSAQQASVTPGYEAAGGNLSGKQGAAVRLGGVSLYPKVALVEGRNDNVLGDSGSISSTFTSLQPELNAMVGNKGDRYGLVYRGNYTRYSSSSADNFNNHSTEMYGDNVFTAREKLSWGLGYQVVNEPRGGTVGTSLHATPDRWHAPTARALFTYGAKGAAGKVELEGNLFKKTYENNLTDMAKLDVRTTNVAGRFFYRVMPKTSALVEVRQINNNYTGVTGAQPNNTERRYLAGVTWEATAATTGTVKVGRSQKSFSDSTASLSGNSWEGSVRWVPLTYSTVDLMTSRTAGESTGVGTSLDNTNYSLAWTHNWSSQWATRLSAGKLKTDFVNSTPMRSDDTKNYGARLTYDMRRWLRFGLDYTRTDRTSSDTANNFVRNVTMFTVEGTL